MMKTSMAIVSLVILTVAVVSSRAEARSFDSEAISQVSKGIAEGILMNEEKKQKQSNQTIYVSSSLSGMVERSYGKGVRVVPGVSSFNDNNYSIKSEIRQWELNKQVELGSRYISRLPTNPWVGVAGDITIEMENLAYKWYINTQLATANVFRGYQGLPALTVTTIPVSLELASISYRFASIGVGAVTTFTRIIDTGGKAMQVMNPPIYLNEMTSEGWKGEGSYSIPGGDVYYQETLKTKDPGAITRTHTDWITTRTGTSIRHIEVVTPTEIPFDRFMMYHYPVGGTYDLNTTISTTLRTRENYRMETIGGIGIDRITKLPGSGIDTWNSWKIGSTWNYPTQAYNPTWKTGVSVGGYGITNYPPPNILFSTRNPLSTYTSPTFNVSTNSHYWTLKTPSYPSWRRQY